MAVSPGGRGPSVAHDLGCPSKPVYRGPIGSAATSASEGAGARGGAGGGNGEYGGAGRSGGGRGEGGGGGGRGGCGGGGGLGGELGDSGENANLRALITMRFHNPKCATTRYGDSKPLACSASSVELPKENQKNTSSPFRIVASCPLC